MMGRRQHNPTDGLAAARDRDSFDRLCVLAERRGLHVELHAAAGRLTVLAVASPAGARRGVLVTGRTVWTAARELLGLLSVEGERDRG